MPIQKKFCFKNSKGEDIYLFSLINKHGTKVSITNYGAIITAFKVKTKSDSFNDIVLGFDNVEDYLSDNYLKHYAYLGAAVRSLCKQDQEWKIYIGWQRIPAYAEYG
jgi:aldose 1-epimerase